MFCDSILGPVKQWGFLVKNLNGALGWQRSLSARFPAIGVKSTRSSGPHQGGPRS